MTFTAEERRKAVGMSDMGAVLGISPFKSTADLFLEYTGRLPVADENDTPTPWGDRSQLYWGNALEPAVADAFQSWLNHHEVRSPVESFRVQRDGRAYAKAPNRTQCHLDYRVVGQPWAAECKTSSNWWVGEWGEPGTDQIPENYLAQVHGQFWHVPTLEVIYVPRLTLNYTFTVYRVEKNPDWFEHLDHATHEFWWHVDNDTVPSLDFTRRTVTDTLKVLYPGVDEQVVHLGGEAQRLTEHYVELTTRASKYGAAAEELKAEILAQLGNASHGVLPAPIRRNTTTVQVWQRKPSPRKEYTVEAKPDHIDVRLVKDLPKGLRDE